MSTHSAFRLRGGQATVHLRLIETTDLHLHLLPWDYYSDSPRPGIGLASAAALIDVARGETPNSLLLDNGDFLQGTPIGDLAAQPGGLAAIGVHPAIAAMNALGYDAINLGNHEFNYGLDFLMRALDDSSAPILSANLAHELGTEPEADRLLVKPYAMLERTVLDGDGESHLIRIGVLGLAPPQIVDWDRHLLGGRIAARDIVESARAWVPRMRADGADIVLVLAHTGIGATRHTAGMENAAIPLARVPGIDALLLGHNHQLFPAPAFAGLAEVDSHAGTVSGIPAVMGGCFGTHIGLIDLLLAHECGRWQVLGSRSEVRGAEALGQDAPVAIALDNGAPGRDPLAGTPPGADIPVPHDAASAVAETAPARVIAAVAAPHRATLDAVRQPIGIVTHPLHSYFAHLGATGSLALVAEAKAAHVRNRLTGTPLADLPILSSVAPFKCGGLGGPLGYTHVPAGPLALRHVADLYPFPNAIAALRLTGAEVLDWLERAASAYNQIIPGSAGTLLRNPNAPGYHFEVIEPLEVLYDLTVPARYDGTGRLVDAHAQRVIWALHEGVPIDPQAEFVLCTNSYRLGGAGGYAAPNDTRVVLRGAMLVRDILREHIARCASVTPVGAGSLAFTPIPGTAALYETGPGARAHLHEIAAFSPELRGTTRTGFLRLRIDLSGAGS